MRVRPAPVFVLALLASCGGERGPARVEVGEAVVTLPAAGGRPGAAYFTLRSRAEARLTGIDSARAGRIALHDTGMRPAASFAVSPSEPLRFAPGGRHAMLFDLDPSLRPGARIALTFSFEGAPPVTVEAEVRAAGDLHGGH